MSSDTPFQLRINSAPHLRFMGHLTPSEYYRSERSPYYIVAPDFTELSSGIRVLHFLCHMLNRMGYESYVTANRTSEMLWTPQLTDEVQRRHFVSLRKPIVVYPEVVAGAPLGLGLKVRYLLNKPGFIAGHQAYDCDEIFVAYRKEFVGDTGTTDFLTLPAIDPTRFNPHEHGQHQRTGRYFYFNRYLDRGGELLPETAEAIEISPRVPRTLDELAAIFKKAELLYCYDDSAVTVEARMCGCPVVYLPNPLLRDYPDDAFDRNGAAWGNSEEQVAHAKSTVGLVFQTYMELYKQLEHQAERFIELTQNAAAAMAFEDCFPAETVARKGWAAEGTPIEALAAARAAEAAASYALWRSRRTPQEIDGQIHAERMVQTWRFRPRYTIAVDIEAAEQLSLLADTIDALARQWYPDWRLVVFAANLPEPPEVAGIPQVVWISDADLQPSYRAALAAADADFVTLLPVGTTLDDHALQQISDHINRAGSWLAFYLDHDEQDAAGNVRPRFKPDFNIDLLCAQDYIGPAAFICREAISAFPDADEGGAEAPFGILVKLFEQASATSIGHIADPMIHLPAERSCTADYEARVLAEHFARTNRPAEVLPGWFEGTRRIRFVGDDDCLVSVIVMTHCLPGYLRCCLESLRAHGGHQNLEVIVVAHRVTEPDLRQLLVEWEGGALGYPVTVMEESGDFNPAAFRNRAAAAASGEALLFLDDDAELFQPDSLRHLLSYLRANGLAAVAPRLVSADEGKARIVGSANILGFQSLAGSIAPADAALLDASRELRLQLDQSISSLPSNCLLVDRAWFERLGGFDATAVPMLLHDLDFCLRAVRAGARLTWLPSIDVTHHQGKTLSELASNAAERERWARAQTNEREVIIDRHLALLARDPAYNRNLSFTEPFRPDVHVIAEWDVDFRDRPRLVGVPLTTGAGQYRIVAPFKALARAGLAQTAIVHPIRDNLVRALTPLEVARLAPDTLVYQNCVEANMIRQLGESRRWNKDVLHICTIDDRLGDLPRDNPLYAIHARQGRTQLRKTLSLCDRLIVSTEPLREYCADLIGDIVVVPNRLEREVWTHLEVAANVGPKPRVGWVGAMQHGGDLRLLEPVVSELAEEVDWIFMGMCPDFLKPYVHEVHDFVSIHDYPAKMASLALDLALAPLEIHPFNECKSNLRLLEYGALGWPVICTDIDPYRTGSPPVTRLPNTPMAWIAAIRERLADRDALRAEGIVLRQWVHDRYMLDDGLETWLQAFLRNPAKRP